MVGVSSRLPLPLSAQKNAPLIGSVFDEMTKNLFFGCVILGGGLFFFDGLLGFLDLLLN